MEMGVIKNRSIINCVIIGVKLLQDLLRVLKQGTVFQDPVHLHRSFSLFHCVFIIHNQITLNNVTGGCKCFKTIVSVFSLLCCMNIVLQGSHKWAHNNQQFPASLVLTGHFKSTKWVMTRFYDGDTRDHKIRFSALLLCLLKCIIPKNVGPF